MSTSSITPEPADPTDPVVTETPAPVPVPESAHPDPITGEAGAHPVGVGVGALSAGAAGAAIGSVGGPIGVLIGAAIGAVAGGLAGKEVASTDEAPVVEGTADTTMPTPISMNSLPGEGLRALGGAAFSGEGSALREEVADDALPVPTHAEASNETGFEAPQVAESAPLAVAAMPHSGEEAVRVAAYYHFLERHTAGQTGDALDDWLTAEREMMLG